MKEIFFLIGALKCSGHSRGGHSSRDLRQVLTLYPQPGNRGAGREGEREGRMLMLAALPTFLNSLKDSSPGNEAAIFRASYPS